MLHGIKVIGRGDGEPGLDNVHSQFGEIARDFEFFRTGESGSGGLFSVAEGGVKDADVVGVGDLAGDVFGAGSSFVEFLDGGVGAHGGGGEGGAGGAGAGGDEGGG